MEKSVFTPHYDAFRARLVRLREEAGLTQRGLAAKLRWSQNSVSRIELGERRLDVLEFFWLCQACGSDPEKVALEVMREAKTIEKARRRRR